MQAKIASLPAFLAGCSLIAAAVVHACGFLMRWYAARQG
jgi:hypothetical protein